MMLDIIYIYIYIYIVLQCGNQALIIVLIIVFPQCDKPCPTFVQSCYQTCGLCVKLHLTAACSVRIFCFDICLER